MTAEIVMTNQRARLPCIVLGLVLCLPVADPVLAQPAVAPGAAAKPATDEFAARGQREARSIRYGDWQKFCFKPGGAKTVCRTTISGTFETGQIAVRVYVTEREGDSTARLQLFLPVGLYMPPGVKLTVDKGAAHKIPFTWCLTNTCIASDLAKAALLRELEGGKNLVLEVVDTNLVAVTTSLPLDRFAVVNKGTPIQIFEQEIEE
jgi:invasion protein IalB